MMTEILIISLDGHDYTPDTVQGNKDRVSNGDDDMLQRDDSML